MVATQETELEERENDSDMVGRAIFTIVPSRAAMNVARDIAIMRGVYPRCICTDVQSIQLVRYGSI